jgi:hypothetical protein
MEKSLAISPYEIVGSPLCVTSDDGQKVFERIAGALKDGKSITVSFRNVSGLTPVFLNASIGQLYSAFSQEEIRARLKVKDLAPADLVLLKCVVDTAKEYFKDPDRKSFVLKNL